MSVKGVYVVTEKAFWHLNAVRRKSLSWLLAAVRNEFRSYGRGGASVISRVCL